MPSVTFPDNEKDQRRIYCILLDLPKNTKLSTDELVQLCCNRGYIHIEPKKEGGKEDEV